MKALQLLGYIMALLAFFPGCKDTPSGPTPAPPTLAGRLEEPQNWRYERLDIAVSRFTSSVILDSTTLDAEANFSLRLPFPAPPDSMLRQFEAREDSSQYSTRRDRLVFSRPEARYAELTFLTHDRHGLHVFVFQGNVFTVWDSVASVGDYHVQYYYLSAPTKVTGRSEFIIHEPALFSHESRLQYTTEYDLDLAAGWNAVTTTISADDGQRRTYQVRTADVPSKKWFATFFVSEAFRYAVRL